jgi:type IV pilus modification protein PilV
MEILRPASALCCVNGRACNGSRGSTVVEMVAALLVMAVGIIGVAALYSDTASTNTDARLQIEATELAQEIATRIESNASGRIGYVGTVGVVCNPTAKSMNAQDAAANEAACWEDRVEKALPSGSGSIMRDTSTTPTSFIVSVSWSAPDKGAASYVIQVKPTG